MATTSPSFSEATPFEKIPKGKRKKKEAETNVETLTSKQKLKKLSKENNSSELTSSKALIGSVPEPVWEIEYSEPVPDLYPELSDSLKMQESDTEQDGRAAKICESHCDSEENIQCVPTSFDDNHLSQDSPNNPGTSQQSQNDSQQSNSNSQTTERRKRKLAKPKKVRKRSDADNAQETSPRVLGQAQETGKQGTWAQCSIPSCGKWRFLQNDVDPQEIPERWVCAMNENDHYNTCSASQETFDSQGGNLDVMYTPYPSGAVVWAKMVGYPWWPAMMENDPDYGYYCETGEDNVTPVSYHVVFFDKQVSRAWVNAACIRNFSSDDDPEDMGKVTVRGKNYRRQLTTATLAARSAVQMPLQTRLSQYGFAARYEGTIGDKAAEEEREANLEVEELGDSVTDSSSQDICSSGNSYSSLEEVKRVKPKTPPKPKTSKQKPTNRPAKGKAKTKESGSSKRKKYTERKKDNKANLFTSQASVKVSSNDNKECLPNNNDGGRTSFEMSEPIHEPGRTQKQSEDTPIQLEPSVPFVSSAITDSEEAICKDEKSVSETATTPLKASDGNQPASKSKETKVVKKRQTSGESRGGKKRKLSKDIQENSKNSFSEKTNQGEKEKENVNEVTTTESISSNETPKEQNMSEKNKQPDKCVEKDEMDSQDANCVKEDAGESSKLSASSEAQQAVSKEKQQRKNSGKPKGVSQDNLVEKNATVDKLSNLMTKSSETSSKSQLEVPKEKRQRKKSGKSKSVSQVEEDATVDKTMDKTIKSTPSQSLIDNEDAGKGKGPARLKNQANKAGRQSNIKQQSKESRRRSGEEASGSEVLDQNGESKQHPLPQKPCFALKRSAASTDVRVHVALSEDSSARKTSLPKLVKAAFKPPMTTKGERNGKAPVKMPKLLKPHFISPALAKAENNHDVRKEEQTVPRGVAQSEKSCEKNTVSKKEVALKRKAQRKDQCSTGNTSKKAREDQPNNILSEDLQAEIDEIDNDIASIQRELRVSSTSDRSLPEEMTTPSIAELQISLSDSPEF